jgi:hypothetical protein
VSVHIAQTLRTCRYERRCPDRDFFVFDYRQPAVGFQGGMKREQGGNGQETTTGGMISRVCFRLLSCVRINRRFEKGKTGNPYFPQFYFVHVKQLLIKFHGAKVRGKLQRLFSFAAQRCLFERLNAVFILRFMGNRIAV